MPVYDQYDPNDPYSILDLGQQYNPSQGYPLKQVSDEVWDLIQPTPDYLVAQQFGALTPWKNKFSTDAFFAADPMLRGPLAEALANGKGDTIDAYNYLQSPDFQSHLKNQIGRTEWDQLAAQGNLGIQAAQTPEEMDQAALNYYMQGLEGILAAGAPTTQRNAAQYDWVAERMGGRPYPGAGQDYPQFNGPGFMDAGGGGGMPGGSMPQGGGGPVGGSDPMAALAGSPAYGGTAQSMVSPTMNRADFTTAPGQNAMDLGMASGPDRLAAENGQRFAVIGGHRYAIPETDAGPYGGESPAYQAALHQILARRQQDGGQSSPNHRAGRGGVDFM